MNYFQRKALSDLTGKDINELQRIGSLKKTQAQIDKDNPKLAAERLKLEKELAKISGSEAEQKKKANELAALENVSKARSVLFDKQKEQVMLALGKAIKPIGDILYAIAIGVMKAIAVFTELTGTFGAVVVGVVLLIASWKLLKKAASSLFEAIGKGMGDAAEAIGGGIGKGLEAVGKGIRNFGRSVRFLVIPPQAILGIIVITGALIGLGYAFKLVGEGLGAAAPGLKIFADLILGLGNILATTFLSVLDKLPTLISGLTSDLLKLALLGPTLTLAAVGIGAFGYSLAGLGAIVALFPTSELTRITNQLNLLGQSAAGIREAAGALKEFSGIKMPEINFTGVAALAAVSTLNNASKKEEVNELKAGLQVLADKFDNLTSMMASGKIAVYLDRVKVSKELAEGTLKFGVSGQATNAF
jgi:hypothetical protein